MSAPCSAASAASNSDSNEPACRPFGRPRLIPTPAESSPNTGLLFPISETSAESTGTPSNDPISSVADSHASRGASLDGDSARPMNGGSGLSSHGAFATYDPTTSSWRTSQGSLWEDWATFSEAWPRWGSMRTGRVYRQRPLVPLTFAGESSFWLTPVARDYKGYTKREGESICNQLRRIYGGSGAPNPTWFEWLMGFPIEWTAVSPEPKPLVTPSSPRSLSGSDVTS